MALRVRDWGGVKANLTNSRRSMLRVDQLELVNVEVWPTRVGQCWGLTNSSRSMLRFDQLESVSVEVWPTRDGQCWGLNISSRSMLRFGQLESVNVDVWPTRVGQCWGLTNSNSFIKQNISVGHFWWSNSVRIWPTQSATLGGGGLASSRRSMLRFEQLESVSVEVWPTRDGQCWGLANSRRSMLRFEQLESVNVEVWLTRIT